jgi:hypothetical protein
MNEEPVQPTTVVWMILPAGGPERPGTPRIDSKIGVTVLFKKLMPLKVILMK